MTNEKRLIDANTKIIEKYFNKRLIDANALRQGFALCEFDTINDRLLVSETIYHAPIVDAVEVVHGQWIEHPKVEIVDGKWISNYECSECCCFYRTHENYCGHCGTKMDGDGNA